MKTEKQGKVKLRFAPKCLANSGQYLVRVDGCEKKVFATQTEAFAFALPRNLVVYKLTKKGPVRLELCDQVNWKLVAKKKFEARSQKELHDGRWNSEWMRRGRE